MARWILILMLLIPGIVWTQLDSGIRNVLNQESAVLIEETGKAQGFKPEILSGGFIDFVQNGQVNSSARLFRLYIGEQGKFRVPVSIYTGITGNHFSTSSPTDVVYTLINPGAGLFNMSFDGSSRLIGKKEKVSSVQFQYQAGFRFLNIYSNSIYRYSTFLNWISGMGLTFITNAWQRGKEEEAGVFWLNMRGLFSNSPPSIFKEFTSGPIDQNVVGYSAGMGLEIAGAINIKAFYFQFVNNKDSPAFTKPFLQLSFNYSGK